MELTVELIGVIVVIVVQLISVGIFVGQNKAFKEHITFRLDELEKKQDKHNSLIERMYVVEQSTKVAHERIDKIENHQ